MRTDIAGAAGGDVARPIKLKYLYLDPDRHGNWRLYVRRKGIGRIRLRAKEGTPEFLDEYRRGLEELQARKLGYRDASPSKAGAAERPDAGSLAWLIEQYYSGGEFRRLAARTQHVRRLILDRLRHRKEGGLPYIRMEPRHVAKLRDEKADLPEAANAIVKALRQVFRWAKLPHVNLAKANPAAEVPYLKPDGDGFHTWTLEEVEAFEARHASGTKARLALALLLYTGVRRSDVVRLGKQHRRDGWIRYSVTKGAKQNPKVVEIPVVPELMAEIEAAGIEGQLTYLQTQHGKPYSADGFGNWFRRMCDQAGLQHCSAHGLRKAGATLAAEGGATERQLMAIYGWETMKEAARYTRKARKRVLAEDGMPALQRARRRNAK